MSTSLARQLKRCEQARDGALADYKAEHERNLELQVQLKSAQTQITALQESVNVERVTRISAQRGLVNYMREHGLTERIGYDPDQDETIKQEIAEGKLPPRNDPRVVKEIAALVIAARQP